MCFLIFEIIVKSLRFVSDYKDFDVKRLFLSLLLSSAVLYSGCSMVDHIMTYRSPANYSVEEAEGIYKNLSVADNVYDNAVIVRAAMSDDVAFDEKSQVYNFDTGRSVFRTYNLPLNATNLKVEISVQIGETIFAPTVALLNKDKKLLKMFDFNSFEYRPYNDVVAETMKLKFNLNNFSAGENAAAYMVIFTKDEDLKTSTKVVHPAKLFALSHRQAPPEVADPLIPHSRLGAMTVLFSMDAESIDSVSDFLDALKGPIWGGESHQYVSDDDDGRVGSSVDVNLHDGNLKVVNPKTSDAAASTGTQISDAKHQSQELKKSPSSPAGSMMKETEKMYNDMIVASVKSGDIAKAMQLAAEATNAGSGSANDTLNSALRSYHRK